MKNIINDWESFWDDKSKSERDFAATGRGIMDELGFLHTYSEVCRHLSFSSKDILLDIGCGTGLFTLAISPHVSRIDCIDLSSNMVERAQKNLNGIENVTVWRASLLETSASGGGYDKCLVYSVIQYLQTMAELQQAMEEIYRILKPKGKALVAGIPDKTRKHAYEKIIWETNERHSYRVEKKVVDSQLWLSAGDMLGLAKKLGFKAEVHAISDRIWQHFYMYDLTLIKE